MPLVIGGQQVAVPRLDVMSWLEHGLSWKVGESGVGARQVPVELVVVHCTGGERSGGGIHQTLTQRHVSVEFAIDATGGIWQYLDPMRFHAAHAGGLNRRAVGIECANAMRPTMPNARGRPLSKRIVQACDPRVGAFPNDWTADQQGNRLYYRASRRVDSLGLFPAQLASLRRLVEVLCDHHPVPLRLADERDYVPVAERASLRGVVGHVQCSLRHGDPSVDALDLFT